MQTTNTKAGGISQSEDDTAVQKMKNQKEEKQRQKKKRNKKDSKKNM